MLVIDRRVYDTRTLDTLVTMLKHMPQMPSDPILRSMFGQPVQVDCEDPIITVDVPNNTVLLYFPGCYREIKGTRVELDVFIIYDLEHDDDGGESFNQILTKYNLEYIGDYWYNSFREAIDIILKGGDLANWAPSTKAPQQKKASYDDLDDFLSSIPDIEEKSQEYEENRDKVESLDDENLEEIDFDPDEFDDFDPDELDSEDNDD